MFDEGLSLQRMVGMLVTLASIGWVVMDGNGNPAYTDRLRQHFVGFACGVAAPGWLFRF